MRQQCKAWIFRLGSEPQQSWRRFQIGLALFAGAAALILIGSQSLYWLQLPGLVLLVPALGFAGWGYAGLFANRFAQTLERTSRYSVAESETTNKNSSPD